ncbi:MAG TPA: hypothetical protein VEB39_07325 [Sphingomicrobium sp.]|nr:hypothetical protein [Sphingomicrobium sp.]
MTTNRLGFPIRHPPRYESAAARMAPQARGTECAACCSNALEALWRRNDRGFAQAVDASRAGADAHRHDQRTRSGITYAGEPSHDGWALRRATESGSGAGLKDRLRGDVHGAARNGFGCANFGFEAKGSPHYCGNSPIRWHNP